MRWCHWINAAGFCILELRSSHTRDNVYYCVGTKVEHLAARETEQKAEWILDKASGWLEQDTSGHLVLVLLFGSGVYWLATVWLSYLSMFSLQLVTLWPKNPVMHFSPSYICVVAKVIIRIRRRRSDAAFIPHTTSQDEHGKTHNTQLLTMTWSENMTQSHQLKVISNICATVHLTPVSLNHRKMIQCMNVTVYRSKQEIKYMKPERQNVLKSL